MRLPIAIASLALLGAAAPSTQSRICNVRDYGAKGTHIWLDTVAFQKAIDDCAARGGGTVRVPHGEYLIGPISLRSRIRLEVQEGAEVIGATDPDLFGGLGERGALISARGVHDVAIVGEGLIDGQGAVWWERIRRQWRDDPSFATDGAARQGQKDDRPRLIIIEDSKNVLIQGPRFENSPSFHLVIQRSEDVTIDHVRIRAPASAPNTDAIDPIDSRRVRITNNDISVGDDVVAIKSNGPDPAHPDAVSSDIVITGNTIRAGRGICIGSGTSGGVRNVLVTNNVFTGSMYGFRIKTARGRGGVVRDVIFRDNRMTDVEIPLVFTSYYAYRPLDEAAAKAQLKPGGFLLGNQSWPGADDPAQPIVHDKTPDISGIVVDGLIATGASQAGIAVGLPEKPIGLTLRNVRIAAKSGLLVRHAAITASGDSMPTYRFETGGSVNPPRSTSGRH
jgi:polygalacturonase